MSRYRLAVVTTVAALSFLASVVWLAAAEPRPDAQWLMYQHDRARTGRTPAVGAIHAPRIAWKVDPAGMDRFLHVRRAEGRHAASLPPSSEQKPFAQDALLQWDMAPRRRDVCGKGGPVDPPAAEGARWGKFLPGVPGLQRLSWTSRWPADGKSALRMHSFEKGADKPTLVWEVPWKDASLLAYLPYVAVLDVDNDGKLEAAVSKWYGVVVYDLASGREKHRLDYRPGDEGCRQYGYFGAYRDAKGQAYLVVNGTFAGHFDCVGVRDGKLQVLWYKAVDSPYRQGTGARTTITTSTPGSVGDFTGRGRGEFVIGMFNKDGDERWHILGFDLATGEETLDLPDQYLRGIADLDGDGRGELLTQRCPGPPVGTNGELAVYRWNREACRVGYGRWALGPVVEYSLLEDADLGGLQTPVTSNDGPGGATVYYTAVGGRESVHAFRLAALGHPSPARDDRPWIEAPSNTTIDVAAARASETLVRLRGDGDAAIVLSGERCAVEQVAATRIAAPSPNPLVLLDRKGKPQVVAADPLGYVGAWAAPASPGAPPKRLWRKRAHGMSVGTGDLGLCAADINGDGITEVLAVVEAPDGHARLIGISPEGVVHWSYPVKECSGWLGAHNQSSVQLWAVGHFSDPYRLDVAYTYSRASLYTSNETAVVTGWGRERLWRRDMVDLRFDGAGKQTEVTVHGSAREGDRSISRPASNAQASDNRPKNGPVPGRPVNGHQTEFMVFGGGMMASGDLGGDGLDCLVTPWPSYSVVRGEDGRQLYGRWFGFMNSRHALVWDFNGDGRLETFLASPQKTLTALHKPRGQLAELWALGEGDGATGPAAVGDSRGDGKITLGLPGFKNGFRCLDGATGKVLWTLPRLDPAEPSNCVACDINGDGRQEFLYGDGKHLLAVGCGDNGQGRVVWRIELPGRVGNIAVGDVRGDGKARVVCGCDDGAIYCVAE